MMGRSRTAWRTNDLPPDWLARRDRVLKRDGYRCQARHYPANDLSPRCLEPATDVDHVVPAYLGGGDEDSNLQSLCRKHHRSKTGREARAAQPDRKRPPEQHPGLT